MKKLILILSVMSLISCQKVAQDATSFYGIWKIDKIITTEDNMVHDSNVTLEFKPNGYMKQSNSSVDKPFEVIGKYVYISDPDKINPIGYSISSKYLRMFIYKDNNTKVLYATWYLSKL